MAEIDYTTSGTVTKPVVLTAVAKLLGISTNDLGTLCKSNKVNVFSHYKPIRCSGNFISWTSELGKNVDWGYWIPEKKTVATIASWINEGTYPWSLPSNYRELYYNGEWKYLIPEGGTDSPFRLGDFISYNHKVASGALLACNVSTKETVVTLPTDDVIECVIGYGRLLFELYSKLYNYTEFASLENGYFGVIVVENSSTYKMLTHSSTLSNSGNMLERSQGDTDISSLFPTNGTTYKCALVVSDTPVATPSDTTSTKKAEVRLLPFSTFKIKRVSGNAYVQIDTDNSSGTKSGKTVALSVLVKNSGNIPAKSVSITIAWESEDIDTETLSSTLNPGKTAYITRSHSYTVAISKLTSISITKLVYTDTLGVQRTDETVVEIPVTDGGGDMPIEE